MHVKSVLVFHEVMEFASFRGNVTVSMKLQRLLKPDPTQGHFLDQYILSWIAYRDDDPSDRVLVDCHEPYGIHIHINDEPRKSFSALSIPEARLFFFAAVKKHFGILEKKR